MQKRDYSGEAAYRIESITRPMVNACIQHPTYNGESDTRGLCGSTAGSTHPMKENNTTHGIVRVTSISDGRTLCDACKEMAERMGLDYPE